MEEQKNIRRTDISTAHSSSFCDFLLSGLESIFIFNISTQYSCTDLPNGFFSFCKSLTITTSYFKIYQNLNTHCAKHCLLCLLECPPDELICHSPHYCIRTDSYLFTFSCSLFSPMQSYSLLLHIVGLTINHVLSLNGNSILRSSPGNSSSSSLTSDLLGLLCPSQCRDYKARYRPYSGMIFHLLFSVPFVIMPKIESAYLAVTDVAFSQSYPHLL